MAIVMTSAQALYKSIEHKQIYTLAKSELPNPSGRPKNGPNTLAISVDLDRPQSTSDGTLHKPFKIKDLGILTYISRKSASRRFSWCNSQLLTPEMSQENGRLTFLLGETSSRKNRLR